MESSRAKFQESPPLKTLRIFNLAQIFLRLLAISTALAAAIAMRTAKQSIVLFGTPYEAKSSYSTSFKFFIGGNAVACGCSILSLLYVFFLVRQGSSPNKYFFLFIHDLVMMSLLMSAAAAATAEAYIGRHGNKHSGWTAICHNFGKFCNKITLSLSFSYFSFLFMMILTIISARSSTQIQA
ncbi:CASP-like protein 1F1 [Mangifera indica]|uniref:CASP-like protein 1F1 n=1 Tax=Mangifera indica TaxID=29780 RepID=UPI001CFA1C05|nr:CASP-like protein 1F1 [Mangifera indica]